VEIVLEQRGNEWYWWFNNEEELQFGPFSSRREAVEDAIKHQQGCANGQCGF